ncbi:MAG: hypothetical protein WAS73_04005 [Defluviicoccus sp.]
MAIVLGTNNADTLTGSQDGEVLIGHDANDTLEYIGIVFPGGSLRTLAMFGDAGPDVLMVRGADFLEAYANPVRPSVYLDGGSDGLDGGTGNDVFNLTSVTGFTAKTGFVFRCLTPSSSGAEQQPYLNAGFDLIYGCDNPGAGTPREAAARGRALLFVVRADEAVVLVLFAVDPIGLDILWSPLPPRQRERDGPIVNGLL